MRGVTSGASSPQAATRVPGEEARQAAAVSPKEARVAATSSSGVGEVSG